MERYFEEPKLYGEDLLKAIGLDKFHGEDRWADNLVTMYGYSGTLETIIGKCRKECHFASYDENGKEFQYHKQAALIILEAVKKINKLSVPESLENDQPYSDGRL